MLVALLVAIASEKPNQLHYPRWNLHQHEMILQQQHLLIVVEYRLFFLIVTILKN
jgi:hypothetical protein